MAVDWRQYTYLNGRYFDDGEMTAQRSFCKALRFSAEHMMVSTVRSPILTECCQKRAVVSPSCLNPSPFLCQLLAACDSTRSMFQTNIRA